MNANKKNNADEDLAEDFARKLEQKLKKIKKKEKLDNEDFNNWLLFGDVDNIGDEGLDILYDEQ